MAGRLGRFLAGAAAAAGFVIIGASPAAAEPPDVLVAERTVTSLVPSNQEESGPVLYYDVAETAVLTGDVEATEEAQYRCMELRDVIFCRGVATATGTVLGQEGTFRTKVIVVCDASDPAFPCKAWGVVKGVDGELADLRATATASGAGGRATVEIYVTRI